MLILECSKDEDKVVPWVKLRILWFIYIFYKCVD
jgi:hypothetical protein